MNEEKMSFIDHLGELRRRLLWSLLAVGILFIPAYVFQTERYFDLAGSLTYISLVLVAWFLSGARDPRSIIIGGLVIIWACRLGIFLLSGATGIGGHTSVGLNAAIDYSPRPIVFSPPGCIRTGLLPHGWQSAQANRYG